MSPNWIAATNVTMSANQDISIPLPVLRRISKCRPAIPDIQISQSFPLGVSTVFMNDVLEGHCSRPTLLQHSHLIKKHHICIGHGEDVRVLHGSKSPMMFRCAFLFAYSRGHGLNLTHGDFFRSPWMPEVYTETRCCRTTTVIQEDPSESPRETNLLVLYLCDESDKLRREKHERRRNHKRRPN